MLPTEVTSAPAGGELCHVTVPSLQEGAAAGKSPPRLDPFVERTRSLAGTTRRLPIPVTSNFIRECSTGLESTPSDVPEPKFVVADAATIIASSDGTTLSVVRDGGGAPTISAIVKLSALVPPPDPM